MGSTRWRKTADRKSSSRKRISCSIFPQCPAGINSTVAPACAEGSSMFDPCTPTTQWLAAYRSHHARSRTASGSGLRRSVIHSGKPPGCATPATAKSMSGLSFLSACANLINRRCWCFRREMNPRLINRVSRVQRPPPAGTDHNRSSRQTKVTVGRRCAHCSSANGTTPVKRSMLYVCGCGCETATLSQH